MSVPHIYSVTETRLALSHLVTGLADGTHGRPKATLLAWDLFDQMRDALSALYVLRAVPALVERLARLSGVATATVGKLTGSTSPAEIRFWSDVVADLRSALTLDIVEAIDAIATSDLAGEHFEDARLAGQWAWLLVSHTISIAPANVDHLIWRRIDHRIELVAALQASDAVARAWQPGPDPERGEAGDCSRSSLESR